MNLSFRAADEMHLAMLPQQVDSILAYLKLTAKAPPHVRALIEELDSLIKLERDLRKELSAPAAAQAGAA